MPAMPAKKSASRERQPGLALILVLWILALMTIMAGSFALSTQREAALLSHAKDRASALAVAEGAVYYAMLMLSLADVNYRWQGDGRDYAWQMDDARVRLKIYDESGKLDLNAAQPASLKTVFKVISADDNVAEQFADIIMDWRDPDDLKHMHGAEETEYQAAGRKPGPQNRNFYDLEELRGVLGITPELYRRLRPLLTIYTGRDGVNPHKAGRDVLLALTGGDAAVVDQFLVQRRENPAGQTFPPVPGVQFVTAGDQYFTVRAEAAFPDQVPAVLEVVIKRGRGLDGLPFSVLRWKAQPPSPANETAK